VLNVRPGTVVRAVSLDKPEADADVPNADMSHSPQASAAPTGPKADTAASNKNSRPVQPK